MQTIDARGTAAADVARAVAEVTAAGGVVVFPTDTVYGIGCDARSAPAVERIFALKQRPRNKPLALHLATLGQFESFAGENAAALALGRAFLPGAITIVVRRPPGIGTDVTAGLEALGLRVPDHELCRTILLSTGPLAATSANLSGSPAFSGGSSASAAALPDADLFVDDGATPLETESTVIDVSQSQARVVREGAIPIEQLERILGAHLR